jgi:putative ABC transport system permease protein
MRIESLTEGAMLALDQIRGNKFRSGLTILGIVIGVGVVMLMSAAIQGIKSSIVDEMEAVGPQNFLVARFNMNEVRIVGGHDGPPWGTNPKITVEEARRIAQLPAVRTTVAGIDLNGEFVHGRTRLPSVSIAGRENGWTNYSNATIIAGHDMLLNDVRSSAPIVLLSEPLAETMFGALDPIGRTLRINGKPFQVIGVFRMSESIFSAFNRNLAIMPYTSAMKHLAAWDGMMQVFTVTSPNATQQEAMDQVITLLRTMRGLRPAEPNDFAVVRQEEFLNTFNRVTGVFFMVMLALSSVALMVGGVGVVAIMMIAVTERTREIGIRKAIGATQREILWQFLFEAVTLTCIGAMIGMAVGAGGAFLIATFTPIPATVPFTAVIAALAMAVTAGVLFGMWPAWKAARMDPVEALRYE